jgi:hypothetical protein
MYVLSIEGKVIREEERRMEKFNYDIQYCTPTFYSSLSSHNPPHSESENQRLSSQHRAVCLKGKVREWK